MLALRVLFAGGQLSLSISPLVLASKSTSHGKMANARILKEQL